jgi:multidrug efflux system membrane fusion protein
MKRTPLVAGAIGIVLLLGWWSCGERALRGNVSVVVRKAQRKDVPIFVEGLGTVQAFNTVLLRARVDGQLVQLSFTEGQDVKAGDLLAVLDSRPYQAILDEAIARKAQNDAQLANARVVLERNARLLARKVIDQQSYDTAKLAVDQLEAASQAEQAAIDRARTQLDYTQIRSPIDGRTGIRLVDLGNVVLADDPTGIVLITQLQPISIVFALAEQHLQPALARRAAGEHLPVLALESGSATRLGEGTLTVVDNQIDQATGTVKMKAAFPNDEFKLWPGKFVTVRLLLTTRKDAVVIPASAVCAEQRPLRLRRRVEQPR